MKVGGLVPDYVDSRYVVSNLDPLLVAVVSTASHDPGYSPVYSVQHTTS